MTEHGKEDLVLRVSEYFLKQGRTLGFAESCTGGLLSSWITSQAGVSRFFRGGVVSYHADAKIEFLSVAKSAIQSFGEVSEPVARAMARGLRQRLEVDWAVAVTGIAGPTGGTSEKPVGTVCFAVAGPGIEKQITKLFKETKRTDIQETSCRFALEYLWQSLNE